jgi:hypothetical protein
MNPPTSGPITEPIMKLDIQTAIAVVRWASLWNMLRIRARVEGIRVAPAMPSTARVRINISGLVA